MAEFDSPQQREWPLVSELLRTFELFRCFRVALDPKKLLVAAGGILAMSCGWWLISVIFYSTMSRPHLVTVDKAERLEKLEKRYSNKTNREREEMDLENENKRNREHDADVNNWMQMHILAGSGFAELEYSNGQKTKAWGGRLRTLPWYEDRGPNPYLLVTGQVDRPWERGRFPDWFTSTEVPVLIEPLVKFLEPIVHLLNPSTSIWTRIYLLVIMFWTLAIWALFGGIITRMAAVELAGKDPVGIGEACRFVTARYWSYLCGPLVPIGLVALLVVFTIIFGFVQMIPFVGDVVSGLLWWVVMLFGFGMALLLVGLVGYPLMYPTISAEGSDTLDALSRSYNYVYQSPFNYIWYCLVAVCYGAIVTFLVGFVGSMTVYLGKWAMSNTPAIEYADRRPEYLFIYTPTSFGWKHLLLRESQGEALAALEEDEVARRRRGENPTEIETALRAKRNDAREKYDRWHESYWWYNKIAAGMVSFWITLAFLMVLGFGYSFFWTSSTMIYLLMRKKVEDTDLDEVYLEETDLNEPYFPPTTPAPTPSPGHVMVDAPTLKTSTPPSPPSDGPPPESPAANN
jgi:hypothetical protein